MTSASTCRDEVARLYSSLITSQFDLDSFGFRPHTPSTALWDVLTRGTLDCIQRSDEKNCVVFSLSWYVVLCQPSWSVVLCQPSWSVVLCQPSWSVVLCQLSWYVCSIVQTSRTINGSPQQTYEEKSAILYPWHPPAPSQATI